MASRMGTRRWWNVTSLAPTVWLRVTAVLAAVLPGCTGSIATGGSSNACTPEGDAIFCARLGAQCDGLTAKDNCGASRVVGSCGSCTLPQTCGGGGVAHVCGAGTCTPTSCSAEGKSCGTISDHCTSTLDCGSCVSPQSCGGGGTAHVCGCAPTTCSAQGKNCGSISDRCGGTLNCGSCNLPRTCGGGGTANVCGDSSSYISLDSFFIISVDGIPTSNLSTWVNLGCNTTTTWGNPDASGFPYNNQWGSDTNYDNAVKAINTAAGHTVLYQIRDQLSGDVGRIDLLAWVQQDEPDGNGGLSGKISQLSTVYSAYKTADPNRPVQLNFGGSDVLVTGQDYAAAMPYGDWINADIYPFTGWLDSHLTRGDITLVGQVQDKLQSYLIAAGTPDKPRLAWIEAVDVGTGGTPPTGAQVSAMIWNAIIHGARGVVFWTLDSTGNSDATTAEVRTAIGAQATIITSLAPVLQGAINPGGVSGTVPAGLQIGWRSTTGAKYFIVQNTQNTTTSNASMTLTGTGNATTATVFGESRDLAINSGVIADSFAPYAVHIYEVN
jgi:hypothetical protein